MIGAAHKTILYDYVLAAKAPAYFFRSLLGARRRGGARRDVGSRYANVGVLARSTERQKPIPERTGLAGAVGSKVAVATDHRAGSRCVPVRYFSRRGTVCANVPPPAVVRSASRLWQRWHLAKGSVSASTRRMVLVWHGSGFGWRSGCVAGYLANRYHRVRTESKTRSAAWRVVIQIKFH
jgi:hypothetical protein